MTFMEFTEDKIYHIYNEGNNKRNIFLSRRNYIYFLTKMKVHLLPHGELLSFCLMPNHFHWQLFVRNVEIPVINQNAPPRFMTLNDSIGILLRSYARAINKEKGWSGSLFRNPTKAKDGWEDGAGFITVEDKRFFEGDYGNTVFDYIHDNPVKGNLVRRREDWEYSSAKQYYFPGGKGMCNKELAKKILGREDF